MFVWCHDLITCLSCSVELLGSLKAPPHARAQLSPQCKHSCVSVPSHKASLLGERFHQNSRNFKWQKPYIVPSLPWQTVALPLDFSDDYDLQNTNLDVGMMIQTQNPDTRRAEYAGKLEINKFLLQEWCGMEVMDYRISLDCWACGASSAKQPCLKGGSLPSCPSHKWLLQRAKCSAVAAGRPCFHPPRSI